MKSGYKMNFKDKLLLFEKFPNFSPIIETNATTNLNNIFYSVSVFVSTIDFAFICSKQNLVYKIPWEDIHLFEAKTGVFSNAIWLQYGNKQNIKLSFTSTDSVKTIDTLSKALNQIKTYPKNLDMESYIKEIEDLKNKINEYEILLTEKEHQLKLLNDNLPISEETINEGKEYSPSSDNENLLSSESFNVVGINYESRSEKLKKMINAMKKNDEFIFLYDDLKGKELKEALEIENRIFEIANYENLPGVYLEKEPDNLYDANAIKVMVSNEYGKFQIGYAPKDTAYYLNKYVDTITSCTAYIYGGKYKELDLFEEKIKIEDRPYGLKIDVWYQL